MALRRWMLIGAPGVGKGTYASLLCPALNVQHVAAGDLVREEIASGSPRGLQIKAASSVRACLRRHTSGRASCGSCREVLRMVRSLPHSMPAAVRLTGWGFGS
jgi:hypothetical protein